MTVPFVSLHPKQGVDLSGVCTVVCATMDSARGIWNALMGVGRIMDTYTNRKEDKKAFQKSRYRKDRSLIFLFPLRPHRVGNLELFTSFADDGGGRSGGPLFLRLHLHWSCQ